MWNRAGFFAMLGGNYAVTSKMVFGIKKSIAFVVWHVANKTIGILRKNDRAGFRNFEKNSYRM